MRHRAGELAVDTRFQLVFIHFPVPHLLGIYDRRAHDYTGDYSTSDSSSYLDNLALADRTLGDVRRSLEHAGLWDETALLVTSDHPLRDWIIEDAGWWKDHETASLGAIPRRYVPFLFKIPNKAAREVHEPLNGLEEVHDLILRSFAPIPGAVPHI
jgi:arylsulfatase A-like enzyme